MGGGYVTTLSGGEVWSSGITRAMGLSMSLDLWLYLIAALILSRATPTQAWEPESEDVSRLRGRRASWHDEDSSLSAAQGDSVRRWRRRDTCGIDFLNAPGFEWGGVRGASLGPYASIYTRAFHSSEREPNERGAGKSVPRCVSKEDYMAEALAFYTVDG